MGQGIFIVPAGAQDCQMFCEIYNANPDFLRHHLGVDRVSADFIRAEMAHMEEAGFVSALLKDGGQVVGLCDYKAGPCAYLSLIMMRADKRGQGLGARCYRALEALLKEKGAASVRIDVVDDYPGHVVGFWEKQGFAATRDPVTLTWGEKTARARVMTKAIY